MLIVAVRLVGERDMVVARQHTREVTAWLGLDDQTVTRAATAVSEVARDLLMHCRGGRIEFSVDRRRQPWVLAVGMEGAAPADDELRRAVAAPEDAATFGFAGAARLVDLDLQEADADRMQFCIQLPISRPPGRPTTDDVALFVEGLESDGQPELLSELVQQNRELLTTLEELRRRQLDLQRANDELADTNRGVLALYDELSSELDATNRGVVALYAELDERTRQLGMAMEARTRFFNAVSHELRTPLNSILALVGLLQQRVDGDLTAEQERQIGYIETSAAGLLAMVDELLDDAKFEAGRMEIEPTVVEVNDVFAELRETLRPLTRPSRVDLQFGAAPRTPIVTDRRMLTHILRNLVSNALKFTEDGEVRVTARLSRDGSRVRFVVRDTGAGIPEAYQEAIFEDFVQVPSGASPRARGTGLGLPLARRLARVLGGDITVTSAPGEGSKFVADLSSGVVRDHQDGRSEVTVLVVDDDPEWRRRFAEAAQGEGRRVIERSDGAGALEVVDEAVPDLVVLDLVMPGVDGWQVLDELETRPSAPEVVVVTSARLDDRETEALEARVRGVVDKRTLEPGNLRRVLRASLHDRDQRATEAGAR